MKKVKKIKNRLGDLIKGKITQKDLAYGVGVTEATLSSFMNMRRSTLNIELINKIITAFSDGIISESDLEYFNIDPLNIMSSLFEVVDTFELDRYGFDEKKFYLSPTEDNIYFRYSNNPNDSYIETLEVLSDGRVIESTLEIPIEKFNPISISERFKKHADKLDDLKEEFLNDEELVFIHEFINVTIYEGVSGAVHRYKTKEEAVETIKMLYL